MAKANFYRILVSLFVLAAGIAGMALTAQAAPTPGSLIKRPDHAAVYYFATDGKRYVFPNERVFRTWYVDFAGVQTVTAAEMAAIPIGGNVTYRPGFRMIKIDTDPRVYAISRGGILRPLASEAVAEALFGSGWARLVDDIPDAFFVNYAIGATITNASDFNRETELASAKTINSDKKYGDLPVTTPLPPVPTAAPMTTPATCSADTWACGEWNTCSPSGMQSRACTKTYDCPSVETPMPVTSQSCTYAPAETACTADTWYCQEWGTCSPSGNQTRFCTKVFDCAAIDTPMPSTTQSCTPPTTTPACTEDTWYCTQWSSCPASGATGNQTQTRYCTKTYDCDGVETPMPSTSQACTSTETACTADTWTCADWNACSPSGAQSRSCTLTYDCPTATTPMPSTYQQCTPPASCTADTWTCEAWNVCTPSGYQSRACSLTYDCPSVYTPMPSTYQYCTP